MTKNMKKILTLLIVALTTTAFAQIPTSGLVGFFPFSGNANDVSATNNNGTVSGASLTTDRFGNPNSAYSFNGTTNYITIPHNNAYNNQYYAIAFWYKFSTPATSGSGGNNVNPGIISKVAALSTVTYNNWIFYEGLSLVGFGTGVGGASGVGATPTGQNDGQWRHVVMSVASDSIRTYVNGVKTSSSLKGTNLTFNNNDIFIGRSNSTYWKAYQGSIDDLAIYNQPLSSTQVTQLYTGVLDTCFFTVYDTTFVTVTDTNHVTVTDTNYVTAYDTNYISVVDTLIINAVLTGINPPNNINSIKIYPNPASSHIYINNGNYALMSGYTIRVDNSLSQTVFTSLINQQQFYVDLSSWSGNGTYFVYIKDNLGNTIEVKKIILQ